MDASAAPLPRGESRIPELLAPAGDWECAKAAVENGADAIYFGLDRFNARMRARNFTTADLPELMSFLHRRGVRGYVTFNTLVFTSEIEEAREYLRAVIAAGVDAAIVQDIGICRLIREISPDFPIHGSTQMTVTSPAGVEFARSLGCHLVVLARENSLKEIGLIQKELAASPGGSLPLEVFVHGALCVAYSGQCLTSESLGGRSANRGECAQACRMPYELVSDGVTVPLGDRRYLLSPQDLAGISILPEIVASGVTSLKIEGRLKSPEYVAAVTGTYRKALDRLRTATDRTEFWKVDERGRYALEMSFSRGLHPGWFDGINNQELAHARFGKKRGVYLGRVEQVRGNRVVVELANPVKAGDGVVFDAGQPDQPEEGGRIYHVRESSGNQRKNSLVELEFGRDAIQTGRIHEGDRVWKTNDPELDRELRRTFAGEAPRHSRPIELEVHGMEGGLLIIEAHDELSRCVRVESSVPLAAALRQPLSSEKLAEQLGRLGGTVFHLARLTSRLEGSLMLPVSELNRMRREIVEQLERLRAVPLRWTINPRTGDGLVEVTSTFRDVKATGTTGIPVPAATSRHTIERIALVRSIAQLEAAVESGVGLVYCDFEDPKRYREAVGWYRRQGVTSGMGGSCGIFVTAPRIFKPGEEWILQQVESCEPDGFLVRNVDQLVRWADRRKVVDFSMNVANPLSARTLSERFRVEALTISYDLNVSQVIDLVRGARGEVFELTLHQHMPMFHMEHCVFCAFLSSGTDFRNCGRPCDRHEVRLRDRVGMEHPLKADVGCRNTVFNARAQTGAEFLGEFVASGIRRFRIEFVQEAATEVSRTLARYDALFRGEITGTDLWRDLKLDNQLGVTRGQLERSGERKVYPTGAGTRLRLDPR